ncbi:MAG: ParB/RepB/Spo0J family partition protein [Pseudobdellovibrionaceae bacterium]|nr:ParB/RepB/Spo0J family partition protein [Pseudobdellovibrionaceae bacterium]
MSDLSSAIDKKMVSVANRIASVKIDSERLAVLRKHIGKIVVFNIDEIDTSQNIRKSPIDRESPKFMQLVESIKKDGLLQNIVVELREADGSYSLVCLAGHRRIAAMQVLKNERITCLLLDKREHSQSTSTALSENQNREDLHFLDVADGYAALISQGWTVEDVSQHYERDRKTIQRYLKMAKWSSEIKTLIRESSDRISLRTIVHEFVNKSFEDDKALLKVLKDKINDKRKGATKTGSSGRKTRIIGGLEEFYKSRSEVTPEMRSIVEDALKFLKFL